MPLTVKNSGVEEQLTLVAAVGGHRVLYGLSINVPPHRFIYEILVPKMMVSGGQAFGR